jgi:hypothetical protein
MSLDSAHSAVQKHHPRPPIPSDESHREPSPWVQYKNRVPLPKPLLSPIPLSLNSLSPARSPHRVVEANPSPVSPSPRVDHRQGRRSPSTFLLPLCSLSACLYQHRGGQISRALIRLQGKLRRTTPCRRRLDTGGAHEPEPRPCMQALRPPLPSSTMPRPIPTLAGPRRPR